MSCVLRAFVVNKFETQLMCVLYAIFANEGSLFKDCHNWFPISTKRCHRGLHLGFKFCVFFKLESVDWGFWQVYETFSAESSSAPPVCETLDTAAAGLPLLVVLLVHTRSTRQLQQQWERGRQPRNRGHVSPQPPTGPQQVTPGFFCTQVKEIWKPC